MSSQNRPRKWLIGQLRIKSNDSAGDLFPTRWADVTDDQLDQATNHVEPVLVRADTMC